MAKKQLLKRASKKGKQGRQEPGTPDEFLAAGVEEEEGGEKWRAGDAVKAVRFLYVPLS